jgi:hypothetical protein
VADFNMQISQDYRALFDYSVALRGLFLIDKEGIIRHDGVSKFRCSMNKEGNPMNEGIGIIEINSKPLALIGSEAKVGNMALEVFKKLI